MEHPFRTLTLTVALAVTATLGMGPATAQAQSPLPPPPTAVTRDVLATNLIHASFIQDGVNRQYLIKLPTTHDPARTYPVILGFGGMGDSAAGFRAYSGLEEASANEAIIVYGQGVGNAWAGAPYATSTMEKDIAYVQAAIDDVVNNYGGDAERVYAVGMSNGGGMAAALGCRAPHLVDAVAAVAGAYYDPAVTGCDPRGRVPTLLIHGTNDALMNYNGGTRHGATYRGAHDVFTSVAARNHCTLDQVRQAPEHPGAISFRPAACEADTQLVQVGGGGHDWFYTPSVANVTWDFFQHHR